MDDKEKAGAVAERHFGVKKDCAKECAEIGKLKRHVIAVYIVLAVLAIIGIMGLWKFEKILTEDTAMRTEIAAHTKRLDIQRNDINRQDDRIDALQGKEGVRGRKG